MDRTPEEQDAYDKILAAMDAVMGMGLTYNVPEFVHAIHTMQHFVTMHVMHRIDPEFYSNWYGED